MLVRRGLLACMVVLLAASCVIASDSSESTDEMVVEKNASAPSEDQSNGPGKDLKSGAEASVKSGDEASVKSGDEASVKSGDEASVKSEDSHDNKVEERVPGDGGVEAKPQSESVVEEETNEDGAGAQRPASPEEAKEIISAAVGEALRSDNSVALADSYSSVESMSSLVEASENAMFDLHKSIELCAVCHKEINGGGEATEAEAEATEAHKPAKEREGSEAPAPVDLAEENGKTDGAEANGSETADVSSAEHGVHEASEASGAEAAIEAEAKKWQECFAKHDFANKSPMDCDEFTAKFKPKGDVPEQDDSVGEKAPRGDEGRKENEDGSVLPPVETEPASAETKLKEFCNLKKSLEWQEATEKTCWNSGSESANMRGSAEATTSEPAGASRVYAAAKNCFVSKHLVAVDPSGQCREGFSVDGASLFEQHCNCDQGEERVKVSITRGPAEEVPVDGQEVETFPRLIPCKAIGDRRLVCFKATAVEDSCRNQVMAGADGEAMVPCACYTVDADGHAAKLVTAHEAEVFAAAKQTLLGAGCSAQAILGSKDCSSSPYPSCETV